MKRYSLVVVALFSFCASGTLGQESPWPMFRHDLQHTGRTPYTGPATPSVYWAFPADDGIASSPSIGADGTIYVGAGWDFAGVSDSCLYAVNPDGSLKWCFETGQGIFSSPAIGADGTIYVGSHDRHLYAIEDSITYGRLKWRTHLGFWLYSSPAVGPDGTIYVGSLNFNIYALNPEGQVKWFRATGWCVFSSPAIGHDGAIYIGSKDHHLYALEDSVTYWHPRWTFRAGVFYDGHLIDSSPAIGPDGTVYVGTDPYGAAGQDPVEVDTVFFAVNPDGTLKWKFAMEDGAESSPAIAADGTIYVGSYDGNLYAIADSGSYGALKWAFPTGGPIDGSPTVDGCGTVYVGSHDSTMYAINPDGTLRWSFPTGGEIESSPTIDGNGILYFGSFDGNLYALGTGAPDVGLVSLEIPGRVNVDSSYSPMATVRNYRAASQGFEIACIIDTQGQIVYGDTASVSLAGGGVDQLTFSQWTVGPDTGVVYTVTVANLLGDDGNPFNDSLTAEVVSTAPTSFIRGDSNADLNLEMADVIFSLRHLYVPGQPAPTCMDAADADDSGVITMGDPLYLAKYLYVPGWPPPPPPFPSCGVDVTADSLGCIDHPCSGIK